MSEINALSNVLPKIQDDQSFDREIRELLGPTLFSGDLSKLRDETLRREISNALSAQTDEGDISSDPGIAKVTLVQTSFDFQDFTADKGRGFGDPGNYYSWSITEYNRQLIVGTLNFDGGDIWKTSLDETNLSNPTWEKVLDLGPEVLGFRELIEYQGQDHAFTTSESEGAVETGSLPEPSAWVCSDNGETWNKIVDFPVNNPSNSSIRTAIVYDGLLYPSYRVPRSFNGNNDGVMDGVVFKDQLYISTANLINGFSVFRTSDPLTG